MLTLTADAIRKRIIRAFWHRTRRQFAPLTLEEICRRAVCTVSDARPILLNLAKTKAARSHNTGAGQYSATTWELLPNGQRAVMAQMAIQYYSPTQGQCDPAQPGNPTGTRSDVTTHAVVAVTLSGPGALNPLPANGGM